MMNPLSGRPSEVVVSSFATRPLELVQRDFRNPSLEWRRLFAEGFGTFLLVFVAAGAGTINAVSGEKVSLAAQVVSPGLMVMAIILFMGATSGAHLNPAVSISFAARKDFPWRRVPGYIAAQMLGALLASLCLLWLFGNVGSLGATNPGPGVNPYQALALEVILTMGLVSTILGTASKAQNIGALAAIAVGGYIALAGLFSAPISGASMNPARSLGPDIVGGNLGYAWIYIVGPIVGGLIAVGIAHILRGPGGDQPAIQAAQGRLPEILRESAHETLGNNHRPTEPAAGSTGDRPG